MTFAVCRNGSFFGAPTTVSVGSSPQVFQNPENYTVRLLVAGNALNALEFSADGVSYFAMGAGGGLILLNAGEFARISWLITPPTSITYIPF